MADTKTTLICFPFAGGSSHAFQPLVPFLKDAVEVKAVNLPGRGIRFGESLLEDARAIADDAWQQVIGWLRPPYAILGHSMGSLLTYLICHKIRMSGLPFPVHVFLSGRPAPITSSTESTEKVYLLPKTAFKAKLQAYGGMHQDILNDEDVFSFFEPIIRADFRAAQSWRYSPQPVLDIQATVITGSEEKFTEKQIQDWQREFAHPIQTVSLPGGHFFLFEQAENFANIILNELT